MTIIQKTIIGATLLVMYLFIAFLYYVESVKNHCESLVVQENSGYSGFFVSQLDHDECAANGFIIAAPVK